MSGGFVVVTACDKRYIPLEKPLKKQALALLSLVKQKRSSFDVFLVTSRVMRKNVLAFPHPAGFPYPEQNRTYLGEIYLNPSYIRNHSEDLSYMLIHGLLHLLGYDHKKRNDRIAMEETEALLYTKLQQLQL